MTLTQFKLTFLFYRYYWPVTVLLSGFCCFIYRANGDNIFAALSAKLLTGLAAWYFVTTMQGNKLYYYYNLHIPRTVLLISFLFTDVLLLLIALWITHHYF